MGFSQVSDVLSLCRRVIDLVNLVDFSRAPTRASRFAIRFEPQAASWPTFALSFFFFFFFLLLLFLFSLSLSLPFLFIHSLTHSLTLIALCCAELSQCFESLLFSSHFHLFFPLCLLASHVPSLLPLPSVRRSRALDPLPLPLRCRRCCATPPEPLSICPCRASAAHSARDTLLAASAFSLTLFSPLLVFFLLCIALRRAAHTTALLRAVPVCLCVTYCTVLYTVQCSYSNVSKRAAQAHEHNFFLHKRFLLPPTVFILIH